MHAKITGRFKPFRKQFTIESKSELQTVFDTDLLWVLEYLELIDNNQHQRLRHCFELRNNSAHPGLAPIKGPNLYSLPAQPVDATQALNLSAGVSNCKVSRGRSFS